MAWLLSRTRLPIRLRTAALVAAIIALGVSFAFVPTRLAIASDSGSKCVGAKLIAAGKYANCFLRLSGNAVARHSGALIFVCDDRFDKQWSKIESGDNGVCPAQATGPTVTTAVKAALVDAVDTAQGPTMGLKDNQAPCTGAQQKALGGYMQCSLAAYAKARTRGGSPDLSRCVARLDSNWEAALKKFPGACFLTSPDRIRGKLDGRLAELADMISGTSPPPATPAPPVCGDGRLNQLTEECDGADDYTCPGACRSDCTCPNQAARIELMVRLTGWGGRPGHEGHMPAASQPVAGQTTHVVVGVLGPHSPTASFRLVDSNNQLLQALNLSPSPLGAGADYHYYEGDVMVPGQSFKVAASGTTRDGSPYDIIGATLFTPQPIELSWDVLSMDKLTPGGTITLRFRLVNHGVTDTFTFTASDNVGMSFAVSPNPITLANSQDASIALALTALPSLPQTTIADVTLTATSATNTSVSTSFTVRVGLYSAALDE